MSDRVAIIGGSGFIGGHLMSFLSKRKDVEVRALVHRTQGKDNSNIQFINGDLLRPDSLDELFSKDCTVINLAFLAQNNLEAMKNLAEACAKSGVRRLIHCSTAVVVGRAAAEVVTESTPCHPVTKYENAKLQSEQTLLQLSVGKFEVVIARPTAVFGPGGKNLLKLANDLTKACAVSNYLKSCVFGQRSMNLVSVDNVVAAIAFLMDAEKVDREIFIVSDDNFPLNNYFEVEKNLLTSFQKKYCLPRFFLPQFILGIAFRLAGKTNINPSIKYSDQKLMEWGFNKPQKFETALNIFSTWYKSR